MSGRLSGKRTLITGGTTGIGLASAQRFIEEGARVAVTGRNPETLAEARNLLGDKALVIESDAGDVSAQQSLVAKVVKAFGGIDVAFLNAGTGTFQPIEAIEEAEFDRQFNINLKGPMFLLKALSPHLGKGASVALNASIVAGLGFPGAAIYGATKAAVVNLARIAAAEWAPRGIRVNSISPGPITTPIYGKLGMPPDAVAEFGEQMRQTLPLQRFGDAREVAEAAVFLASDEAGFITGHDLIVDGGRRIV
ncbi:SDR family oxidoreductase [uncultured Aquimonas sp.]|uniref:SDR family oxidoreductase n=1 Tax=uncultured Aquimonas sp. TaxID=385483 RepID=UPI000868D04C|nr:SDR family oxidoreductase [uncultured Aquimonas sp.]ODU45509.1 MAG: short-chain dehydrogenase [Xanthomonadaceae bacterium SCN 69-123]